MDKIKWVDSKEWLKELLTKEGIGTANENTKGKRNMVYYTSFPLLMQHNGENSGSSQGCSSKDAPPPSGDAPKDSTQHQSQIINLSNNITLQTVLDQPQFQQNESHVSESMQNKLNSIGCSRTRESTQIEDQEIIKSTKFECHQCNMCFGSKSAQTSHIKSHAKSLKYQISPIDGNSVLDLATGRIPRLNLNEQHQCDVCKKTFAVPARLIRHYRTHTGERPFECEFCHKMFSVKENLQVHRRIHTKERPYKCTVCERAFEHSGKLHRHMRIHTGERPHKCCVCGKTFIQSGQLVIHMRTHTGEKPYKCEVKSCGKAFTCSKQLKVHSRTHTGVKPYQCDICFRDFGYNHVLKLHRVQHYGSKCYKCSICDETFKNKKEMEAHIKGHTNDIPDEEKPNEHFTTNEISLSPDMVEDEVVKKYSGFESRVTSQYAVQSSMNPISLLAAASIVASAEERPFNHISSVSTGLSPVRYHNSSYVKIRETYFNHMAPIPEFKPLLQSSEDLLKRVEAALGCSNSCTTELQTPTRSSPEEDRSSSPECDSPHMSEHRDNNTLPPRKRRLYFKDNQEEPTATRTNSVIQFAKAT